MLFPPGFELVIWIGGHSGLVQAYQVLILYALVLELYSGFVTRPLAPPTMGELLTLVSHAGEDRLELFQRVVAASEVSPGGKYRHWDTLRQLTPPAGLTSEHWWLAIKLARQPLLRPLPLKDHAGEPFVYGTPDEALALLHLIDQHASGQILMPEVVIGSDAAKRQYLVNSLMEEAIRSSQLEGATTTRRVAKEMLTTGRPPRNRAERMIVNNYRAMEFIREDVNEALTPKKVLELHRILTDETLDDPSAAGRLQSPNEDRVVVTNLKNEIVYIPPPAVQLPKRLEDFCDFVNRGSRGGGFLHPVIKAILAHFWLAFDHPFVDGNGRTARALFYRTMLSGGYWLTEYLSISKILRQAPGQYVRSFMYTETDERDTTYFILYQLRAIARAIEEFQTYLQRRIREIQELERLIDSEDAFNHRQLGLLRDAVRHPSHRYTFRTHARSHKVTHQTARTDLLDLRSRGLLRQRRMGREYVFTPVEDILTRLKLPKGD